MEKMAATTTGNCDAIRKQNVLIELAVGHIINIIFQGLRSMQSDTCAR